MNDLDTGTDCTLTKSANRTKPGEAADTPEGPGQAGEICPQEPLEVQQMEVQSPTHGGEQPQAQVHAGC